MGWIQQRSRYQNGESPTVQKVEDLVARRVLKGLGLSEKAVPTVERNQLGEIRRDDALWVRTKAILAVALRAKRLNLSIEVYETLPNYTDTMERYEGINLQAALQPICFVTRIRNTKASLTFFPAYGTGEVGPNAISPFDLTPPFKVHRWGQGGEQYWICSQDTELFIRQFGPYEWDLHDG